MNIVKEQAVELLPDDCTLEDIQYHLYVREKVERGIQAINEGRVVSQEPVYAERVGRRIVQAPRLLEDFHLSGRPDPEFNDSNIRELIYGAYRIFMW